MTYFIHLYLGLLIAVLLFVMLAKRFRLPYPIALVIGGVLICWLPGLPHVFMDPDLIFLTILPPILFAGGYLLPFSAFKKNMQPISLLALGLVGVITLGVAAFAHWVWGMPWELGCILGAIISPPDAIAATAILRRLHVNLQVSTILEGESLVNDASALTLYRLALGVVLWNQFSFWEGLGSFFLICGGGIVVGLILAMLLIKILDRIDDSTLTVTISLLFPYLAYLLANELDLSGVLATVTGGIYVGRSRQKIVAPMVRLEANAVWRTVIFLLNGVAFILIGLQLPMILDDLRSFEWARLLWDALLLNTLLILIRFGWVFVTLRTFSWQAKTLMSWCGMRGAVSLAAALALPLTINGFVFPERSLIIFLTFSVIAVSLVLQGLTLPWLVRRLNLTGRAEPLAEEAAMRLKGARAVIQHLDALVKKGCISSPNLTQQLQAKYAHKEQWAQKFLGRVHLPKRREEALRLEIELLRIERDLIIDSKDREEISPELANSLLNEVDFESARLQERMQRLTT